MAAPLDLLFSNGLEKLKPGDIRGAEALFAQAHLAFPGDPVALFLLGMVKLNSSDYIQAEVLFRKALAISPDQPKVCIRLARALRGQHRPIKASSC
jgi:predicted Zn-dependent protease